MKDFLQHYVASHLWGAPFQDRQFIIKPSRLTPPTGAFNNFRVLDRDVILPIRNKRYHVFQIGQLFPELLNLCVRQFNWETPVWWTFSQVMNNQFVMINIYTSAGIQFPRSKVYYQFTRNRDLLIAVEDNSKLPINIGTEPIYIRFYKNAYYQMIAADQTADKGIFQNAKVSASTEDILSIQNELAQFEVNKTMCFINGLLSPTINLLNTTPGDTIEYVYDSTIKRVVRFTFNELSTFISTLDNKLKYLLHYDFTDKSLIEYIDDIDIYISNADNTKGVYYHANSEDAKRMVTYRDYSIVTDYVNTHINALRAVGNDDMTDKLLYHVTLYIRRSGQEKPMVPESSRMLELYKLPDDAVYATLTEEINDIDLWKAATLEASSTTRLFESRKLFSDTAIDSLGYNAVSSLVADTPQYKEPGNDYINLPLLLQTNSTIYSYRDGLLTNKEWHGYGVKHIVSPTDDLFEAISGKGTTSPIVRYSSNTTPILDKFNRVFFKIDNRWTDVTDNPEYYSVIDNTLYPIPEYVTTEIMLRSSSTFLDYAFQLQGNDGILMFTLQEQHESVWIPLAVELGNLDIFLNGHSLIQGIDFYLDFPNVYITNKSFISQGTVQDIHVRYAGFKDVNDSLVYEDTGYVDRGTLSANGRFNIRDSRVMRVIVGGKVYHKDHLKYAETTIPDDSLSELNGRPYSVRDILVPFGEPLSVDHYILRKLAREKDLTISGYMDRFLPQLTGSGPNAIQQKHILYSLFFSSILDDITDGSLIIDKVFSISEVLEVLKRYDTLYQYDPLNEVNTIDSRYVDIHPTYHDQTISVTLLEYRFLNMVNNLYGRNLINLNLFITVTGE